MYDVQNGNGITFGGLYQRVLHKLRDCGHQVETDDRQRPLPKADFTNIEGPLRDGQDVALAAISVSHRGTVDAPTAFGKSFMIAQIVRMYEKASIKILVVTPAKSVVQSLTRRLKEGTNAKVVEVRAGKKFHPEADVVMCSAKSLHHIPADWPHLLLFDECHGVAAPQIQSKMVKFSGCRMFGFSASPEGRLDGADMVVEAFFGPKLVNMPYSEGVKSGSIVPIEVYIKRVSGPDVQYSTDVDKERNGYWLNPVRNNSIAAVARQIPDHMQTLIMVRTTEHALALQKLLPDYSVAHGGKNREQWLEYIDRGVVSDSIAEKDIPGFLAGRSTLPSYDKDANPDTSAMLEEFEAGTLKKAIATTMWKEGIDPIHLRVLIRADGTSGNIPATQIPGRLARTAEGKRAGILIDFLDSYGDTYLRRSHGRIRQYRKKEWSIHEDWDGKFTQAMESV
jgi:superfamily II DNA or RNA helicase